MVRTFRNKLYSAWDLFWIKIDFFLSTSRSIFSLKFQGGEVGKGLRTSGPCYFKLKRSGAIRLGKNIRLLASHRANRVGLSNPVLLETHADGIIEIGDGSGASAVVISSRSKVTIGENVIIGGNVRIFDHDFHSLDPTAWGTSRDVTEVITAPINIGNNVFIGTNVLILKGVSIGECAIIGAGAVVTNDVGDGEIWGGNPAIMIAKRMM